MPAVTADPLTLPRVPGPDSTTTSFRDVTQVVTATRTMEGEGFHVRRPFPGVLSLQQADPFLLLDHMGGTEYRPYEAKGAPDHPHRGFETVTYMLDGEMEHRDSTGSGGIIRGGDTQWMTAGAGIVHSEMPSHKLYVTGGLMHGLQLWVNLPRSDKLVAPRYQDLVGNDLPLLTNHDGTTLIRLIAGELDGGEAGTFTGKGQTYTPIIYAHATVAPGSELKLPWPQEFNALAYVIAGSGTVGSSGAPVDEGQMAVMGPGDALRVTAAPVQPSNVGALEIILLGGRPIREPIVHYGPFVMNTKAEILTALQDYQAGRMGRIPPAHS